ncbi:uncharacterized protein LOC117482512 isoform X2 [Trematomus bernacchii]|nr:uncharacterized protein LOC117482512 isoform X2 [Trematomus bernacchii]
MDEFQQIKMSVFLILLLQFTGAAIGHHVLYLSVRVGDEATFQLTEHQVNDEVTLRCSVSRYGGCRHKVKWLLQGRDVDKDNNDIRTTQSVCSASLTFWTSHFSNTQRSELFTCAVMTVGGKVQTFSLQYSGEDTAATTESDTRSGFTTTASVITEDSAGEDTAAATTESDSRSGFTKTASVITEDATGWWWWIIVVIVGVAALTIITVAVIRRKRTQ